MARVTWLGEGSDGPQETECWGKTFKVGEAVELDNPQHVETARTNKFFKVEGPTAPVAPAPPVTVPPSQQEMPGAVPKPGEPVAPPAQRLVSEPESVRSKQPVVPPGKM